MKPTAQQIYDAVESLTALAMFPTNPAAHREIARLLDRMVESKQALDWLVRAMIDRVGEWKGTAELRAVYCTRWKPVDGEDTYSVLPGFTALDSEAREIEEHGKRRKQLKSAAASEEIAKLTEQKRLN